MPTTEDAEWARAADYCEGVLHVEGLPVVELAARFGTPLGSTALCSELGGHAAPGKSDRDALLRHPRVWCLAPRSTEQVNTPVVLRFTADDAARDFAA